MSSSVSLSGALLLAITGAAGAQTAAIKTPISFTCDSAARTGTVLTPTNVDSQSRAGWDLGTAPIITQDSCSSEEPFFFSIPLPEGNYRVTVTLGGAQRSVATVRAEARRLMIEKLPVGAGQFVTRSFDVNVRVPEFQSADGAPGRVRLKARELGNLDWDPKLTLEFNGVHPSLRSITVEPITEPVVYLAGDSTMVDQDVEPWAAWGQMLPRFFKPGVVIANHAESGESSSSFVAEKRFAKILSVIKPGDWFFVQFGHNDQKLGPDFPTRYREIMTGFIEQVKAKGATPVLVTSMPREQFDAQEHIVETLAPYPQITREIAKATGTTLIDLNAMATRMFEAMGREGADRAFMKFKAGSYPGVEQDISDSTHFNNYGAYELARCIVRGIRENRLPLAQFLDASVPEFNPSRPDAFAMFSLPYTPMQKKEDATQIPQANLK